MQQELLLFPFYRWENWGSQRSSNLPKAAYVVSDIAKILAQAACLQNQSS